jgi:hypothetical protein
MILIEYLILILHYTYHLECIAMIEGTGGMISMITDEGKRPKGSDTELLHAFNQQLGKNTYYGIRF